MRFLEGPRPPGGAGGGGGAVTKFAGKRPSPGNKAPGAPCSLPAAPSSPAAPGPGEDVCKGEYSVSRATLGASSRQPFPTQLVGPGTGPGGLRAPPPPHAAQSGRGSQRPPAGESLAGLTSCRAASGFLAQVAITHPLTRSSSRLRPSTPCLPTPALGKRSLGFGAVPAGPGPPHCGAPVAPGKRCPSSSTRQATRVRLGAS